MTAQRAPVEGCWKRCADIRHGFFTREGRHFNRRLREPERRYRLWKTNRNW